MSLFFLIEGTQEHFLKKENKIQGKLSKQTIHTYKNNGQIAVKMVYQIYDCAAYSLRF